jgi:ribosome-binding protein aMBF1 (putative translation factor)
MPRQRIHHSRDTLDLPDDFPERLRRFQEESGLSWSELARRLETYRNIVSRWKEGRGRPNTEHMMALLELAEGLALGHLFTDNGDMV